jgi:CDP-L-myo-inositol myo-inositolphosphotransferase
VLFAGVLIQVSSIIDGCDGEIARLKALGSRFGAFFDTILDRYADLAIAAGITYGFWLTHPEFWVWLAGIGALSGFLLTSYAKKEYQLRFQKPPPLSFLPRLAKRDLRLFAIFLGALLGQPFFAMLGVGAISHLAVFWILVRGRRK